MAFFLQNFDVKHSSTSVFYFPRFYFSLFLCYFYISISYFVKQACHKSCLSNFAFHVPPTRPGYSTLAIDHDLQQQKEMNTSAGDDNMSQIFVDRLHLVLMVLTGPVDNN